MIHAASNFIWKIHDKTAGTSNFFFIGFLFLVTFVTIDQKLETLYTTENAHHIFTLKLPTVYYILSYRVVLFSSEIEYF